MKLNSNRFNTCLFTLNQKLNIHCSAIVHPNNEAVIKLGFNQCIMQHPAFIKRCVFYLLQINEICYSRFRSESNTIPSWYSVLICFNGIDHSIKTGLPYSQLIQDVVETFSGFSRSFRRQNICWYRIAQQFLILNISTSLWLHRFQCNSNIRKAREK